MAKSMELTSDDLMVTSPKNVSATPQRGEAPKTKSVPTAELVAMQFRMPPDFADAFKAEALRRRLKLNGLLKYCFAEMLKNEKQGN